VFLLAASALVLVSTAGIAKYRVLQTARPSVVSERGVRITLWVLLLFSAAGLACALINQFGYRGFAGFASAAERRVELTALAETIGLTNPFSILAFILQPFAFGYFTLAVFSMSRIHWAAATFMIAMFVLVTMLDGSFGNVGVCFAFVFLVLLQRFKTSARFSRIRACIVPIGAVCAAALIWYFGHVISERVEYSYISVSRWMYIFEANVATNPAGLRFDEDFCRDADTANGFVLGWNLLAWYLSHGVPVFSLTVDRFDLDRRTWGAASFFFLMKFLTLLGITHFDLNDYIELWPFQGLYLTGLGEAYADFGAYMILYFSLLGIPLGVVFGLALRRNIYGLLLYPHVVLFFLILPFTNYFNRLHIIGATIGSCFVLAFVSWVLERSQRRRTDDALDLARAH